MKIFDIIEGTEVNGPGLRLCIWFSGCLRNCPGCFNKELQDIENSKEIEIDYIIRLLTDSKKKYRGVSISGGEPFLQNRELCKLLKEVKTIKDNKGESKFDTLVFSGYTFDELKRNDDFSKTLEFVDILVDGPFIEKLKESNSCFLTGSSNQRVLYLKDGKILRDATGDFDKSNKKDLNLISSEVIIDKDGSVKITGFDDIKL